LVDCFVGHKLNTDECPIWVTVVLQVTDVKNVAAVSAEIFLSVIVVP
jgi:hypothetical protein